MKSKGEAGLGYYVFCYKFTLLMVICIKFVRVVLSDVRFGFD